MEWIKRISMMLTLAFFFAARAKAQTWPEWFSQKKTQQKYLLEQVAALKIYAGYLKKGYEISRSGLTFIKDASKGEFDLHGAFFSSLKAVSPEIKRNVQVAEIIEMQLDISKTLASIRKVDGLGERDMGYISSVSSKVLENCLRDMEALLLLITSGRAELSDDERLDGISRLHAQMQQKRSFALSFSMAARQLAAERNRELENLKRMEGWYENN